MPAPQQRALLLASLPRLVFAGVFFIGGIVLMLASNPLWGIGVLMVAAVLFAYPLAALFADSFVEGMFYNRETIDEIPPIYSIAEARIQEGNYDAARERYDGMMESHPHVLRVYTDAFKLASRYMKDLDYFEEIRARGLAGLPEAEHSNLETAHSSYMDYFQAKPDWQKNRSVAYRGQSDDAPEG